MVGIYDGGKDPVPRVLWWWQGSGTKGPVMVARIQVLWWRQGSNTYDGGKHTVLMMVSMCLQYGKHIYSRKDKDICWEVSFLDLNQMGIKTVSTWEFVMVLLFLVVPLSGPTDGFHGTICHGNWRALHYHAACWLVDIYITWPFCPPASMVKNTMESIFMTSLCTDLPLSCTQWESGTDLALLLVTHMKERCTPITEDVLGMYPW